MAASKRAQREEKVARRMAFEFGPRHPSEAQRAATRKEAREHRRACECPACLEGKKVHGI